MTEAKNSLGYTLVELILAVALFSFVLVIVTAGIINVFRLYQQGAVSRSVQQSTRFAMDDMVRTGRLATNVENIANSTVCFTFPSKKVRFYMLNNGLYKDEIGASTDCAAGTVASISLLPSEVKAASFISLITTRTTKSIQIILAASSQNAILDANFKCDATLNNQFCAAASLESAVSLRGGQ